MSAMKSADETLDPTALPPPAASRAALLVDACWAGVALAVEGTLLWVVFGLGLDPWLAIAVHAGLVGVLGWVAARPRRSGASISPGLALLAIGTAFLGPLGPMGVLLSVAIRATMYRSDSSFEEWYAALFPEDDAPDEAHTMEGLAARAAVEGAVNIGPLMDVLSHGTRPQKQVAIAVLTRNFKTVFAPALRLALRDADNAIRVQAATSMATIENNFMKRAQALEAAVKAAPGAADRLKALARHHDEYAATGLLDPVREARSRRAALSGYFDYLRLSPQDREARLAVARLLMRKRRYAFAARWLELCRRDGMFTLNMAPWYMECLFRSARYADLRAFAREMGVELERLDLFPVRVVEAARLWSGRAA